MNPPGWLVPLLLSLAVICLATPMTGSTPRLARGWAIAALVLGALSAVLVLIATKGT